MMGWFLINLSVAAKQYIDQGSLSLSMVLFQGFCAVSFIKSSYHPVYNLQTPNKQFLCKASDHLVQKLCSIG